MDYILKTSEIILKGKNRPFFEKILIKNIKKKIEDLEWIKNLGGEFLIKTKNEQIENLKKIFGITAILKVKIFNSLEDVLKNIKIDNFRDFALKIERADKSYQLNSLEIFNLVKNYLQENFKINFNKNSKNKIFIEYRNKKFFLSQEKINSFGGLPVGSSGKGLLLISSGFDSPIAGFLSMKRGIKVYFLHFHSYPQTSRDSLEKTKKLVEILNEYNLDSYLYLMNILEIQKFYFNNFPSKYLVIFYRRTMFRLAEKLLNELNLDSLITGENLGQVASQTIENMKVISQTIQGFVLRPLLGFNKQEIIDLAKKIGTEKISSLKGDDCCSLFIPKRVSTKAKLEEILKLENKFSKEINELENKIYQEKEIITYNNFSQPNN